MIDAKGDYVLAKIPHDFPLKNQWPSIKTVGMAVRVTEKSDAAMSGDVRYFIASCYLSGKRFARAVRGHWGIENSLHWVLDVTFDEDQSRTRSTCPVWSGGSEPVVLEGS